MGPPTPNHAAHASLQGTPLFIGPRNAEQVIGWTWRYVAGFARAHGVQVLRPAGKPCVRASELAAAIERVARAMALPPEPQTDDAVRESMRRALGLERVQ